MAAVTAISTFSSTPPKEAVTNHAQRAMYTAAIVIPLIIQIQVRRMESIQMVMVPKAARLVQVARVIAKFLKRYWGARVTE